MLGRGVPEVDCMVDKHIKDQGRWGGFALVMKIMARGVLSIVSSVT